MFSYALFVSTGANNVRTNAIIAVVINNSASVNAGLLEA